MPNVAKTAQKVMKFEVTGVGSATCINCDYFQYRIGHLILNQYAVQLNKHFQLFKEFVMLAAWAVTILGCSFG